ncbi:MAG: ABC transporter permease subunit [Firmicutes bacterium]|nr:ABC transporter permease subunit [Bacillota bacterium]
MSGLSAELVKVKRHKLLWVLLVIMVIVEILIIGGMRYWATHSPDSDTNPDDELRQVYNSTSFPGVILPTLTFSATFGTIFAVIFASGFGGEEYRFGTAKQMISMGVKRSEYVFGKLLASVLISSVFIVAPVIAASAFTGAVSAFSGKPLATEPINMSLALQVIRGFGIAWICTGFYSGFAIFLAIATRSSQTATTIAILMILLEGNIVNSFAEKFSFIKKIAPYSMGRCANLAASLIEQAQDIMEVLSRQDITNAFITLGVWFALFTVLAVLVFKRQELGTD